MYSSRCCKSTVLANYPVSDFLMLVRIIWLYLVQRNRQSLVATRNLLLSASRHTSVAATGRGVSQWTLSPFHSSHWLFLVAHWMLFSMPSTWFIIHSWGPYCLLRTSLITVASPSAQKCAIILIILNFPFQPHCQYSSTFDHHLFDSLSQPTLHQPSQSFQLRPRATYHAPPLNTDALDNT